MTTIANLILGSSSGGSTGSTSLAWSTPVAMYRNGADGVSAATLSLGYTAQTFTYDTAGAASPSSQTITFTANLAGSLTGTATFTCTLYNASGTSLGTVTLSGSGNTRTLTNAQFVSLGAAQTAVVAATLSGNTDQATVVKLRDGAAGAAAVSGLLTNESTTVAADSTGAVASFAGAGGTFMVFDGLTDKTGNVAVTYSVNGTPTGGLSISIASTGVYTVTALTSDHGTATLQAVYGSVTITKLFDISKSRAGADGINGATLTLLYTAQAITFDASGSAYPGSQTITLTASLAGGLTGTATFVATLFNAAGTSLGTVTLGGSGNARTLTNAQFTSLGAAQFAIITASLGGLTDTVTIVKLRDGAAGTAAVSGLLTNESTTVAADSTGAVASFTSAGGTFAVFDGLADKTGDSAVTYSVVGTPTGGLSISIASTGIYTVTALTSDHGSALLQAVYAGVTITKLFDISKSRAGTSVTLLSLSTETVTLAADSTGFVSSYSPATTTATVLNGNTDDTSNWTLAISAGTGVTAALSGTQVLVSAMTADTGYVSVTATRTGYTSLSKRFNLVKARSSGTTAGVVTGFSFASLALSLTTTAASAVRFNADGTVDAKDNTSTYQPAGNWYAPTTSGIGASYWIKAVVVAGSVGSGSTGTVQSLSPGYSWGCSVSGSGHVVANADLAITIYSDSGGTTAVATGTVTLDAETPPYP